MNKEVGIDVVLRCDCGYEFKKNKIKINVFPINVDDDTFLTYSICEKNCPKCKAKIVGLRNNFFKISKVKL